MLYVCSILILNVILSLHPSDFYPDPLFVSSLIDVVLLWSQRVKAFRQKGRRRQHCEWEQNLLKFDQSYAQIYNTCQKLKGRTASV